MTLENAALAIIDVQNDFCPGGALEVPDGDTVAPVINALAPRFPDRILTTALFPTASPRAGRRHRR